MYSLVETGLVFVLVNVIVFAKPELEPAFVVGGDPDLDVNLLALGISRDDGASGDEEEESLQRTRSNSLTKRKNSNVDSGKKDSDNSDDDQEGSPSKKSSSKKGAASAKDKIMKAVKDGKDAIKDMIK